jgi:DNA-binding FadR family transcriptional regulator
LSVTATAPRTPLSETIFVRLRDGILGGTPTAGEPLPSERVLAEELRCNRHAVREAVKRLQQAGLVTVSHGGATRVLDWHRTGGLDLLAHLPLTAGEAPDPRMLRSILELRLCVGADAARRCATRAPGAVVDALHDALDAQRAATPARAPLLYAQLWEHVIDGADNIAYRLAYNSLLAGLDPGSDLSRALFGAEARDSAAIAELVAAIAAGDAERAAEAATDLLHRALQPTAAEKADHG